MFIKTALITMPMLLAYQTNSPSIKEIPPPVTDGIITSEFGNRIHPIFNVSRPHYGVDIAGTKNSKALSVGHGQVIFAGEYRGYGNLVVIKHADQISTHYAHLDRINLSVGEKVNEGTEIGIIGRTGNSTGLHLHFEVRKNGKPIDPIQVIPSLKILKSENG